MTVWADETTVTMTATRALLRCDFPAEVRGAAESGDVMLSGSYHGVDDHGRIAV